MSDDDNDDAYSLDAWKAAAAKIRQDLKLGEAFEKEVRTAFSRAVTKQYWCPLYDTVMKRANYTERVWATVLGVNRTTIFRWRGDLTGESDREAKEPALHHFLNSMAAFDLDGTLFPRGLYATIAAYRETYALIEQRIVPAEKRPKTPITDEEVHYLHMAIRNPDWYEGHIQNDATTKHYAAANMIRRVSRHVKKPTIGSVAGIENVLRNRFVSWAVLETVILYEWIQT